MDREEILHAIRDAPALDNSLAPREQDLAEKLAKLPVEKIYQREYPDEGRFAIAIHTSRPLTASEAHLLARIAPEPVEISDDQTIFILMWA